MDSLADEMSGIGNGKQGATSSKDPLVISTALPKIATNGNSSVV